MIIRRGIRLFLHIIMVCSIGINFAQAVSPSDPNFFCNLTRELYPEFQWNRLKKGDRLGTYEAILTCTSASVTIKSSLPFDPSIQWEQKDGIYIGKISSEQLVPIRSQSENQKHPNVDIDIEVLTVSGEVLYSANRDLIKKHGLPRSRPPRSQDLIENEERQQYKDLKALGWEPLTVDRQLGPWDMIWTQEKGRVEIEILKEGLDSLVDESTSVKDSQGHPTNKLRFPPNSYFIMHPQFYQRANVNKIIGDVWVASDRRKVQEFDAKYKILARLGPMDRDTDLKWREMLKRQELE